MNDYEILLDQLEDKVIIKELNLKSCNGYYSNGVIFLDKKLGDNKKFEILNEEFSHHLLNSGDNSIKDEKKARFYSYKQIMSINDIYNYVIGNPYSTLSDMAEYFNLDTLTLEQILLCYREKYGNEIQIGKHILCLIPLKISNSINYLFKY